jgi:hypothetical protein
VGFVPISPIKSVRRKDFSDIGFGQITGNFAKALFHRRFRLGAATEAVNWQEVQDAIAIFGDAVAFAGSAAGIRAGVSPTRSGV